MGVGIGPNVALGLVAHGAVGGQMPRSWRRLPTAAHASTRRLFVCRFVAVADCCGDEDFVVASFIEAEEMRTVLHRETDPSRSLGEILDSLEGRAREFRAALGDMIKS